MPSRDRGLGSRRRAAATLIVLVVAAVAAVVVLAARSRLTTSTPPPTTGPPVTTVPSPTTALSPTTVPSPSTVPTSSTNAPPPRLPTTTLLAPPTSTPPSSSLPTTTTTLPRPPPPAWSGPVWEAAAAGHIYMSSPTTARVGRIDVVAVGTESGMVELLNAATGVELPGWPRRVAAPPGRAVAIESSPTIAWLDGRHEPPSVIVGTGSTAVDDGHTEGEVEAFRLDGAVRFVFRVGVVGPGTATGVISSPAIGDVTGDGRTDIVFGSWDHELYALTPRGALVPGFPIDNLDTIWSSPALYHIRGPASLDDVFVGSDASGRLGCYGGFVTDYSYADGAPYVVWRHCESQTIWSSPAIGIINSTGRPAVVVGTGFGETTYGRGSSELLAFYADTGATVRGWPVATKGPTPGSPAIGNGPKGQPIVVATSWDCRGQNEQSCFAGNSSTVLEIAGDGTVLGSVNLLGATALSSPVLVPLRGERVDDILVGAASGLYAISSRPRRARRPHRVPHLPFLYGAAPGSPLGPNCPVSNSPALVDIPGHGVRSGWHVIDACGGPRSLGLPAVVASYRLPVQPTAYVAIWPQFHDMPEHDGVASDPAEGDPVPPAR